MNTDILEPRQFTRDEIKHYLGTVAMCTVPRNMWFCIVNDQCIMSECKDIAREVARQIKNSLDGKVNENPGS